MWPVIIDLVQIALHLLQNVSLLALVLVAYVSLKRHTTMHGIAANLWLGIIFSTGALIALSLSFSPMPGVNIDGRGIMVTLSAVFGGPVAAVLTVAVTASYRLWLGGIGAYPAVISMVTGVLWGLGFRHLVARGRISYRLRSLWFLGIISMLQALALWYVLFPQQAKTVGFLLAVPSFIIVPLGIAVLGTILKREDERLQLQRDIEDKSNLLDAVVESIGYGVTVVDADRRITFFNGTAKKILGRGPSSTAAESWGQTYEVFKEDGVSRFAPEEYPIVRAVRGEYTDEYPMWIGGIDQADRRLIRNTARPLVGSDGKSRGGVAVFRDVTEEMRLQEDLRQHKAQLASAILSMENGFALFDAEDRLLVYNSVFISDEAVADFGDPIGHTFAELNRAFAYAPLSAVAAQPDPESWIEWRLEMHRNPPPEPLEIEWTDGRWMRVIERRTRDGGYVGSWTDITTLKQREAELLLAKERTERAKQELEISEALMRAVADHMPALVAYVGHDEIYRYCNETYFEWFGIPTSSIVGASSRELLGLEVYQETKPYIDAALRGETVGFERRMMAKGKEIWLQGRYIPHRAPTGEIIGFYIMGWEITESRRREFELREAVSRDALTGVLTRRAFDEILAEATNHWQEIGHGSTLLYLDIDHFKAINDTLGHAVGDEVLKIFAQHIRSLVRSEDKVARLGGDEFVVLLHDVTSAAVAQRIASDLNKLVQQPAVIGGKKVAISTSIGIAVAKGPVSGVQLLQEADLALYQAKAEGRNTFATRNIA